MTKPSPKSFKSITYCFKFVIGRFFSFNPFLSNYCHIKYFCERFLVLVKNYSFYIWIKTIVEAFLELLLYKYFNSKNAVKIYTNKKISRFTKNYKKNIKFVAYPRIII